MDSAGFMMTPNIYERGTVMTRVDLIDIAFLVVFGIAAVVGMTTTGVRVIQGAEGIINGII